MGVATSQQRHLFDDYDGFVEKFKPKKTTDDCYTPPEIYDVVADYVTERFGIDRADMVRPFYPGGDFENFEYPDGCCVVDNPPFSILQRIKRFYLDNGIPFFLFCPSLTAFSGSMATKLTAIVCNSNITYANGAVVRTAFVTNMGGDIVAESCPELGDRINAKMKEIKKRDTVALPKYEYPDEVLTAAKLQWLAAHHTPFQVRRSDCIRISKLEAQGSKSIFGGGLLLSERAAAERAAAERDAAERAAAERAAAERAAAVKWQLSDREKAIVKHLGR
mgnify:CR=1 FL=1